MRCCASTACSASPRHRARVACTCSCASRPSSRSKRCAAPRSRSRARSSGGCPNRPRRAGGRSSARASSSTTTRTPATAPSPRPTRCAPLPTRASPARWRGMRCPTWSRRSCAWTPSLRACASTATPPQTSTSTPDRSTRCWSWPRATSARASATRPGRRTFASRRASRGGCSRVGRAAGLGGQRPAVRLLVVRLPIAAIPRGGGRAA